MFNNLPKITTIEDIPLYINEISKHGKKPTITFKSIVAGSLDQKLSLFLKNDFNPENEVIIDTRLPQLFRLSSNNNEKFDIIPLKESSGYGKYQVNTRKPGIMVFPGNWASGWKAWINNKKTQVFEANIFSKGILIPPGAHKLMLRYLPDSFLAGSWISIISIFCLTIT